MPSLNEKTADKPNPVFTRLTVDEVTRHTHARVAPAWLTWKRLQKAATKA